MKKLLFILFFLALSFTGFAQHQYTSYVTASGTNTYAVTVSVPTITNYSTKRIHLRFANANSGASTLNVTPVGASPLGAVAIRAWDGDSWEPLVGGEIDSGQDYIVVYNGTYFELYPSIGGGEGGSGEFIYSIQTISGTTHTINATTVGSTNKWFIYTNASGCTVTVDDDVDIGRSVVGQRGPSAGTVTFVDNGTSVLISSSGDFDLEAVNRKASLTKQTSTDWDVTGELGPSGGGGTWGTITGTLSDQTDLQTALDAKQPLDADLTSIAGNTTGGFLTRTASNTYTARTITGTANEITVTNGDGVSGAPTIDIPTNPTLGGANITGVPISTGVSGLGTGVATFLATPSSSNLSTALTDEVGTGSAVFSEPDVNVQTGSYTLVLSDKSKEVRMNVAGSNNLTVPLNSSVAFPIGTLINISQYGAGTTTVVATGGVTINSSAGNLLSPGQFSPMILRKIGTDEWYLWNGSAAVTAAFTRTNGTYITTTLSGSMSGALNTAVDITVDLTGVVPLTLGGTGASSATQTYTPTFTNTTNVSASTPRACQYMRVGNTITVSGQFDIDPTATGQIVMGISLPVASNFTTAFQAGGTAAPTTVADAPAAIISDATNDRATLTYVCVDTTNHTMAFTFTYQVL